MNLVPNRFLNSSWGVLLPTCLLILALLFSACGDTDSTPISNAQVATTLLSQATPLCQNTQKATKTPSSAENLALTKPVIFLTSNGQSGKWSEFFTKSSAIPVDYATLQANTADGVKGVVCVLQTSIVVGKYVPLNGTPSSHTVYQDDNAYRQDLEAWLVSYPDGKVIARNNFKGADPASEIGSGISQYGQRPDKEMLDWLKTQLK